MLAAAAAVLGSCDAAERDAPAAYAAHASTAAHGGMLGMGGAGGAGEGAFMPGVAGELGSMAIGWDPMEVLTEFDRGRVSTLPDGRRLREFWISSEIRNVEIVPGIVYEAWTYNGRVPGPTLRATEGDLVRIHFVNATPHPHTMHFHTVHPANMDGVYEPVPPGGSFTYEFDAQPFGVHPYHCHIMPLASHISRGLYGAIVIDPRQGRPPADYEMVMVMAGNDIDFDNENDFYNVNFIPFSYDQHPIRVRKDALVRVYLVNMLEFDQVNSFHIHANFFDYYPTGTSLRPSEHTDTVALMQAQRGILEFRYHYSGRYMFHAHKTEFAELGWTGVIEVEE
jgi:FtsP/CotA-like multicopper oxidase with cupredoxin domain